jgi:hypothetical protein
MKQAVCLGIVVSALLFGLTASASQNAGTAWNQAADTYHFLRYPQSSAITLSEAYTGSNFASDFAAILGQVARTMSSQIPSTSGNDLLDATLENWPGGSGM